jgi:general secretion pathway protein N
MMVWLHTTRGKLWLAAAVLLSLLVTWPLSAAFQMFGLDKVGVSARSLRGPVWWGGAEELEVAGVRLGTVDVFLNPFALLIGRARIDIARNAGKPDDIAGGITMGFGSRSFDDVTGTLPLAEALAPLPVSRIEFEKFTAQFSGGLCAKAEGRARIRVSLLATGLNLANGLAGDARCDGDALLMPLVSQSGQERLDVRVKANGSFEATMRIKTTDPQLAVGLALNGFRPAGGDQMLRITGKL